VLVQSYFLPSDRFPFFLTDLSLVNIHEWASTGSSPFRFYLIHLQ
jgi:hypothetical protein